MIWDYIPSKYLESESYPETTIVSGERHPETSTGTETKTEHTGSGRDPPKDLLDFCPR